MNKIVNGWFSPNKGAVTSICDIIIDHIFDIFYRINTCRFEKLKTSSALRFNYRATPYRMLHYLFSSYSLCENDHFVDFGCGKGRVFLFAALSGCTQSTGIEFDPLMYQIAKKNQQRIASKTSSKVMLRHEDALRTEITDTMNIFYFFVPFHLKIFGHILTRIKQSLLTCPRKVTIIFYRPDTPWIRYMEDDPVFTNKTIMTVLNDEMFFLYTNY